MQTYRHCDIQNGNTFMLQWIEDHEARLGNTVQIDGESWEIIKIGPQRLNMNEIAVRQRRN